MNFGEALELINEVIPESRDKSYDGICVKRLAASNTVSSDRQNTHQTHIAITSEQMNIFPVIYSQSYDVANSESLKKYFVELLPFYLYKSNIRSLASSLPDIFERYTNNPKCVKVSSVLSKREGQADQIQLALRTFDDSDFLEFRKLLRENDYLIILKWEKEVKYDCFGLKAENSQTLSALNGKFFNLPTNTKAYLNKQTLTPLHLPCNRIIFGAPGTGKSHLLEQQREKYFGDGDHYERVTFHPNYTYSQFVGAYKPVALKNESVESLDSKTKDVLLILNDKTKTAQEKYDLLFNKFKENGNLTRLPILLGICEDEKFETKNVDNSPGNNNVERAHGKAIKPYVKLRSDDATSNDITYSFVPGPFVRTLMKAKQTPSENFLLVIEEINRANAAAVFGDVFQLLDRDEDGKSEYPIDASEDLEKYLEESGVALEDGKIEIPANMYIWATMNSADQGVAPLDAAFKRRWEFEYIGIDDNENELVDCKIPIPKKENSNGDFDFVSWNGFRKALNEKLKGLSGVNEDKLLGPFFISKHRLETAKGNAEDFIKFFKSKVLMYLYEDVCKMNPSALFSGISEGVRLHYSDICAEFDKKGLGIFGTDFSAHS